MTPPNDTRKEAARPNLGGVDGRAAPTRGTEFFVRETRQGFDCHHRSIGAAVKSLIKQTFFKYGLEMGAINVLLSDTSKWRCCK
jgi:hypothetical protein